MYQRDCKKHGLTKAYKTAQGRIRCSKCANEAVQRRRTLLKRMAVEYKGGKCFRCGYFKCTKALGFHHPDPKVKDFGIAASGHTRSWEKLKIELDKCLLVCANCHAEIHAA